MRAIKGWCPGALRPMPSGDGLLVRLRIGGGIVDLGLAAEIARWSIRFGNGQIDLTNRGNLQLRGLTERHLADLHDAMMRWNLLDGSAAGEAVRNVVSSPLAGLDPTAILDIRPIAGALEQRLVSDEALHALPGKFGFAIDDGGVLGLDDVAADIRFEAQPGDTGPEFVIGLDGAPDHRLGPCRPNGLVEVAVALGLVFLKSRRGREIHIRRMRDLVGAVGAGAIGREAGLNCFPRTRFREPASGALWDQRPTVMAHRPPTVMARLDRVIALDLVLMPIVGSSPAMTGSGRCQTVNSELVPSPIDQTRQILVLDLPFGRIGAADLATLASIATNAGATQLRLTPWRAILLPLPSVEAAHKVVAGLAQTAFILNPDDPRRRVAACSGAPSCARATTPVRDDANALAAIIAAASGSDIALHVSGCEKGCAHHREAPITFVARGGRYDLVRDGTASDRPVECDLTLEQAADAIRRIKENHPSPTTK
jgi:precorrin-3B synthase